jgi:spore coat polysaccharide biosynthesis protein SpsF
MYCGAIVQARMSSNRFPGKVLHEISGKPMLLYLIERLRRCPHLDAIVVATSREESDDKIYSFCEDHDIFCYRGSLTDVADRFISIINIYHFDAFIRISGDSPLLDQKLVNKALDIYKNNSCDMVTNVFPRTFPKGQSVEVLSSQVFCDSYQFFQDDADREHVTTHFYKNKEKYNIINFAAEKNIGYSQLSVDTPQDMAVFEKIVSRMKKPHWDYDLDDILDDILAIHNLVKLSEKNVV